MKYFSMFSGVGGFEYGIERAFNNRRLLQATPSEGLHGMPNATERQVRASCIGFSEIDKYAKQIYKKHFGGHKDYGNARDIVPEQLPDFDLLVGGFPCQAFSIAGKRGGFDDTRGTLFFEIARILKHKRPRYFLLENVKGLLSHDSGKTFQTILKACSDIGYRVQWQVLNSKDFGVPQNRERVFIIGHLRGTGGGKVFPIGSEYKEDSRQLACTCLARDYKGIGNQEMTIVRSKKYGKLDDRTLESKERFFEERKVSTLQDNGEENRTTPYKRGLARPRSREHNGALQGMPHETTPDRGQKESIPQEGEKPSWAIRRLTCVECERLQGFPDGWTEEGIDKEGKEVRISDSQRYKVLGNAVTTNVITAIFEQIFSERGKE